MISLPPFFHNFYICLSLDVEFLFLSEWLRYTSVLFIANATFNWISELVLALIVDDGILGC